MYIYIYTHIIDSILDTIVDYSFSDSQLSRPLLVVRLFLKPEAVLR